MCLYNFYSELPLAILFARREGLAELTSSILSARRRGPSKISESKTRKIHIVNVFIIFYSYFPFLCEHKWENE